jgi:hypothetical protein
MNDLFTKTGVYVDGRLVATLDKRIKAQRIARTMRDCGLRDVKVDRIMEGKDKP